MITKKPLKLLGKSAVPKTYLIISISARALVASATKAGFDSYFIDCFADKDTGSLAKEGWQLQEPEQLTHKHTLTKHLSRIDFDAIDGIVLGSGFEQEPEIIDFFSNFGPVYSNECNTIKACSDVDTLFPFLLQSGIDFPEVDLGQSPSEEVYLVKQAGACGGRHIGLSRASQTLNKGEYRQKYYSGENYSCVFIANAKAFKIIGISKIWCRGREFADFSFGGAVSIIDFDQRKKQILEQYITKLVPKLGLIGLCGLDFLITEENELKLLDINPRPTQSFELFDDKNGSLFSAHLQCFDESTLNNYNAPTECRGQQVVYADRQMKVPDTMSWPEWTSDRPRYNTSINAGSPLCTISASGQKTDEIIKKLNLRTEEMKLRIKNTFSTV